MLLRCRLAALCAQRCLFEVTSFAEIISIMQETEHMDKWYSNFVPYMQGIANQIAASTPNLSKLSELKAYLDELDRRRGTNWPALYPWLVEQFNRHNIK